jgi:cobalamin biosynthesis protein CobD/CbiB
MNELLQLGVRMDLDFGRVKMSHTHPVIIPGEVAGRINSNVNRAACASQVILLAKPYLILNPIAVWETI